MQLAKYVRKAIAMTTDVTIPGSGFLKTANDATGTMIIIAASISSTRGMGVCQPASTRICSSRSPSEICGVPATYVSAASPSRQSRRTRSFPAPCETSSRAASSSCRFDRRKYQRVTIANQIATTRPKTAICMSRVQSCCGLSAICRIIYVTETSQGVSDAQQVVQRR